MAAVKVGIPVSLTGQFGTQGRQALAGLQAWADAVNGAGGLRVGNRRHDVAVVHYDDCSLADAAGAAAGRLIHEDRVDLLFGPYSSGLARAVADIAAGAGKVLWNQGGAADEIYGPGRRVVGILSGARSYLAALPKLVREAYPSSAAFGVLRCSDGAFPRLVSEGFENSAVASGFCKVYHREFPSTQADFSGFVQEVLEANPDLLLAVGRIRHDIAIARTLASQPGTARLPKAMAVVATPIDRFRAEMGRAADGFVGPSQWEPPASNAPIPNPCDYFGPAPTHVRATLNRAGFATGVPVDYPMAQCFAAGLVAQRCVEAAGSLEQGLLWAAAGNLDFQTFFGRFKINSESGEQVGRSVNIVQWQLGRKVVIWPPEQAQGKLELYQQARGE
ncbi:MAG: ABC transporter substrate-binding protein [Chloroflexota bacterium]|nr:ABC transporter substrate-binding protein [Chloroflexota bacterium]